ncbi:MAG: RrF2 family transcriptional regulator [Tepidisphaeraceae bacterium]
MLCLSRKVSYALVGLAYLAQNEAQVLCAREVAQATALPLPLLMSILKKLHRQGVLSGVRGARGGYRLAADLDQVSLFDLIVLLEDMATLRNADGNGHGPVQALHYKLIRFLRDVKVSDLVIPGRRIDVPIELLAAGAP